MHLNSFKSFSIFTFLRRTYATPVKLAYEVYNENKDRKPPLMILHGLFGSKQNFRSICRALEPRIDRKIFALDARNHGDSPNTNETSAEHMAVDVIKVMKELNYQKICALGFSIGARAMMYLALKYPTYVESAIFGDMSPLSLPRDFSNILEICSIMREIEKKIPKNLSLPEGRKFAQQMFKEITHQDTLKNFLVQNLRQDPDGKFRWAIGIDGVENSYNDMYKFHVETASLQPYKGPAMFICGQKSNFVDPKSWPEIQKIFPNSEIHFLDAGHLVHFEQPEQFVDLTVKFLMK